MCRLARPNHRTSCSSVTDSNSPTMPLYYPQIKRIYYSLYGLIFISLHRPLTTAGMLTRHRGGRDGEATVALPRVRHRVTAVTNPSLPGRSKNPAAEQRWASRLANISEAPGALRPWAPYCPRQAKPGGP